MEHQSRSRILRTTSDGSPTLEVEAWGVCYHSVHGALTESKHVFIEHGLNRWKGDYEARHGSALTALRVLEIGFGTGLNAALAWEWAELHSCSVDYVGLEPYPLEEKEWEQWAGEGLPEGLADKARSLHRLLDSTASSTFSSHFQAKVVPSKWESWKAEGMFDMVFFDAFAPEHQPELWQSEVFERLLHCSNPGAVLATYCAKGSVRRNMEGAQWLVERLPGPPGKREMLVAQHVPITRWNIRCYALILNKQRTHVMLAKERFPDGSVGYKFPGGGVESGEDLLEAVWRECQEELGTTQGLHWLGHAYTTDFFVRSAFNREEQILSVYHWFFSESDALAWWDERPAEVHSNEPLLEMNWEPILSLSPQRMRFPIDRHVVENFPALFEAIQSSRDAD